MSFAVSITQIAPPWLLGPTGRALLVTFGTMIDNLMLQLRNGIKARFPNTAPNDALQLIGNDRALEQGPSETPNAFRLRLNAAVASNQNRGGARTLLAQLAGFFSGTGTPPMRLVSQAGVWHQYDWTTGNVTKSKGAWFNWDGLTQWWRGWVVIDGTALGWTSWVSGAGVPVDGSYVMGSTAPASSVQAVQRLVQRWKPANVYVTRIIVTFTSGLFIAPPANGRGPLHSPRWRMFQIAHWNPRGQYGDPQMWDANATYWLGGGEEP